MRSRIRTLSAATLLILLLVSQARADSDRKELAEQFFRGVYGCEPSIVDSLASDDILLSYPIIQEVFGVPSILGREAVREFAAGFCRRWADAQITIHDAIAEEDKVVLVWSFRAQDQGSVDGGQTPTDREHSWGGISIFYFDASGKISAEIGEESSPGPMERTMPGKATNSPGEGR